MSKEVVELGKNYRHLKAPNFIRTREGDHVTEMVCKFCGTIIKDHVPKLIRIEHEPNGVQKHIYGMRDKHHPNFAQIMIVLEEELPSGKIATGHFTTTCCKRCAATKLKPDALLEAIRCELEAVQEPEERIQRSISRKAVRHIVDPAFPLPGARTEKR